MPWLFQRKAKSGNAPQNSNSSSKPVRKAQPYTRIWGTAFDYSGSHIPYPTNNDSPISTKLDREAKKAEEQAKAIVGDRRAFNRYVSNKSPNKARGPQLGVMTNMGTNMNNSYTNGPNTHPTSGSVTQHQGPMFTSVNTYTASPTSMHSASSSSRSGHGIQHQGPTPPAMSARAQNGNPTNERAYLPWQPPSIQIVRTEH